MSRLLCALLLLSPVAMAVDHEQELAVIRDQISRHEANLHLANSLKDKMNDSLSDMGSFNVRSSRMLREELGSQRQRAEGLRAGVERAQRRVDDHMPAAHVAIRRLHQFARAASWGRFTMAPGADGLHRMAIVDEYMLSASALALRRHAALASEHSAARQGHEQALATERRLERKLTAMVERHVEWRNMRARRTENLQREIRESQVALEKLHQTELRLIAKIHLGHDDHLEQHAASQLLQPVFAEQKGKLSWPVQGRVRKSRSVADWSGVFIDHSPGQPVLAVSDGRVVYADNFKPMGNMVILDHGDGFMSLYAHDASINPKPGDWVTKGDIIASVGGAFDDSDSVLYFEIRHQGNPLNPSQWCN